MKEGRADGEGVGPTVDLKDPDLIVFAEVVSVPASDSEGRKESGGRFVQRLAVGAVPAAAGVFEVKKSGLAPVALIKRAAAAPAKAQKKTQHKGAA